MQFKSLYNLIKTEENNKLLTIKYDSFNDESDYESIGYQLR